MTRRLSAMTLIAATVTAAVAADPPTAPAIVPMMIVCAELADTDRTRVVMTVADAVTRFELVTPEFLWPHPDQPESRRFAAGFSDVSPDLVTEAAIAISTTVDAHGQLRIVDFASRSPETPALAGLRGSLVLHDSWLDRRAPASLYYTGSDHPTSITALMCTRYGGLG